MNPTSAVTRPAAVAGMFYPASPEALRDSVREFLDEAGPGDAVAPKVLIVPHAGYVYSGSTAARGYATLRRIAGQVRRVVVIGPAHRVAVRGVAIPSVDRFETPLGPIDLDRAVLDALAAEPNVVRSDRAHAAEHALEVQLPFLQEVLGDFTLVPLVVGDATPDEVAAVLERVWGGPETLIVVSSDLSHYLPYDTARRVDASTLAQVLASRPRARSSAGLRRHPDQRTDARGPAPRAASAPAGRVQFRRHGGRPRRRRRLRRAGLHCRRPGPPAKRTKRPVGFERTACRPRRGAARPRAPRDRVAVPARRREALPDAPFLDRAGATFVTLRLDGELRGCLGSLEAERPLRDDVVANARDAAMRDPRFEPLTERELDGLSVEVSLLSPPQPLAFRDEEDLMRQLQAAREGVLLEYGGHRSTFLPQVWEQLPDARDFLRHLKAKAGLSPDFWSPDLRVSRYAVEKWSER